MDTINMIIESKISGKKVEVDLTPLQLLEADKDSLIEELTECDCESVGETNIVECNCHEEWMDTEIYFDGVII